MPWPYTHLKIWLCEADQHKNTNLKCKLFSDVKGLWYKFYKLQIDFFIKACNASISISKQQQKKNSKHTHKKICLLYFIPSIQCFLIVCQTQNFLDLFMLNLSMKSNVDPKKKNAKKLIMTLKVNLTTARRLMYL